MAHAVAFAAIRTTKTREHFAEISYTTQLRVQTNAQQNCPSSGIDERPGRDLFSLKRSPISQPHTHLVFDEVIPMGR